MALPPEGEGEVDLGPGDVVWIDFNPVEGREQGGRRPAIVVSSAAHIELVTALVSVVPVTSTDRGWPNHVRIAPRGLLERASFAMTEQVRTVARGRIRERAGRVDEDTRREIATWLGDWLDVESAVG